MNLLFYVFFTFMIYSLVGWIIEELYSFYSTGSFKKDGFLKEPLKPMYGIAMTILVICYEVFKIHGIPFIILCFLIPTIVEYISGYMLKNIFQKIYWDYSKLKFNIKGYVCITFSFYWCILSYIGVVYLNPVIKSIYVIHKDLIHTVSILMFFIFSIDLIITIMNCYKYRIEN